MTKSNSEIFPLSNLPIELRLKIWRCSLPLGETLILDVDKWEETSIFKHEGDFPKSLHICRESREEALNYYRIILPYETNSEFCHYCGRSDCFKVKPRYTAGYIERVSWNANYFDPSEQTIYMEFCHLRHLRHIYKQDTESLFAEVSSDDVAPESLRKHWISRKENAEEAYGHLENVRSLGIGGTVGQYSPRRAGAMFGHFQKLEQLWIPTNSLPSARRIPYDYRDPQVAAWYEAQLDDIRPFKLGIHKAWATMFTGSAKQEPMEGEEGFAYFMRLRKNGIPLPMIKSMEVEQIRYEIGLPSELPRLGPPLSP